MPIILIGISITVFFMFTSPIYNSTDPLSPGIITLNEKLASYNQALDNSKALEEERDILTTKDNAIDPENKRKLEKLLPENIDNIRLILEIGDIAFPYGMVLKDVKYNTAIDTKSDSASKTAVVLGGGTSQVSNKDYGVWDLGFSTVGTYNNFLNFTRDLEKNLRIVDISSVEFSSINTASGSSSTTPSYKYDFKIKTYWLKN